MGRIQKSLTIIFTILSAVLILDSMNFGYAIAMFLLAGIIPGTNIVVSADAMLNTIMFVSGFILSRIVMSLLMARYFQPKAEALAE